MAYRGTLGVKAETINRLSAIAGSVDAIIQPLVRDGLDIVKEHAVQNLSGVPFTSDTGTHVINKRTGKLAGSLQVQSPYGSPFRGRLFASAKTRYANNPEEWDYGAILEYGRGEIRPKYTPSMRAGYVSRARLTIPGGPHSLTHGENGFRGMTGRYSFVRSIPPMEGKGWMKSALETAAPEIEEHASQRVEQFLRDNGL